MNLNALKSVKHGIGSLFLICLYSASAAGQSVPVGLGSYSTSLPPGGVGPRNFNGADATPKVSAAFDQPVQTNDFWSSLIYPFFGSSYSNILYAHPLNFKAVSSGLEIGYTTDHLYAADDFLYPYAAQLTIGVAGLSAVQTLTHHYGDWTVTALWEDGPISMEATLGHGLPWAFFRITGGNAVVASAQTPVIWYNQNEVLGITISGKHYGVFAPTGSTWSGTSTFQSTLDGKDYLSVALLPDTSPATLELFRSHAYAFVTDSRIEWQYDESSSQLTNTYTYETVLRDSFATNVNQTLTALYRHQWLNTDSPLLNHTYHSPRGTMKLLEGNSFTTELQFCGILPALPDQGNYNRTVLLNHVQDVAGETLSIEPTYENGKAMARFAHLAQIADQLGATAERDHFLDEVKVRLEDLFTVGGSQEYSYDENWDVLTGYPSGFGADDQINDHHFHASYAIMSAATIAQFDSAWASPSQWGGMVNLLIKDCDNWDRSDTEFPFLRTFDAYAGHSWAAGHGDFAEGNNQESSSESMNFASAVVLWGEITNQPEIRDLGIFLHANEASAVDHYWFDVDNEVFPQDYPHTAIGMVWGGKGVHSTWFGAEPEFIHGINMLPVTSGSLYLGRNPAYVLDNYAEVVSERNGEPTVWQDILWEYLALSDPDLAVTLYHADIDYEPFDGESRAHTYHWLYNLKKMGQVETAIAADIPTYSVFRDPAGHLTYVAFNAGSQERMVTFSDGFSLLVGPHQTAAFSTSPVDPDSPVALLLPSRTSGKAPLSVLFTGSNSFDPNDSPLSHAWDFGDGDTSQAPDVEHVFTETGTYTVSLAVTNNLNISSSDSVSITVLENGTPYLGTPFQIPGLIQAEFYDEGGEGVAYHDVDAMNLGVPFRSTEGVDIEASNDQGGGYDIGWIEDGEWLEYTIEVAEAGMYALVPSVSSVPGGGSLHIEVNGVDLTGLVPVPVTGGWQFWQELQIPDVFLAAGEQIMHVGLHVGQFNLNWIDVRSSSTDVREESELPARFELGQNYPNPFNPRTRIDIQLPRSAAVSLKVYNLRGQEVASLADQVLSAGSHGFSWDAASAASGVYLYRMTVDQDISGANGFSQTAKMILLK
ncbi:MAG: carbohydrate-binding protein [Candidatus Cloacimonetes bacterium]|nr:carbohydrate-binding protein [Candidatus Cloacimonadota bacterium]